MSPVAMMSPMTMMMSASRPMLSIGAPLMFCPEDVVRPVSLRMRPTPFTLVHVGMLVVFIVFVVVVMIVVTSLRMHHSVSVIGNDKDHLFNQTLKIKTGCCVFFAFIVSLMVS